MDVQNTLDEFLDLPDQQEDTTHNIAPYQTLVDTQDPSPIAPSELNELSDNFNNAAVPSVHNDDAAAAATAMWAVSNDNNSNMSNNDNSTTTAAAAAAPVAAMPLSGEGNESEQHPLYFPLSNTDWSVMLSAATGIHTDSLTTLFSAASAGQEGHASANDLSAAGVSAAPTLTTTPAEFIPPQALQMNNSDTGLQQRVQVPQSQEEESGRMRTRASSRRKMSTAKAAAAAENATTAAAEMNKKKTKGKKLYCVCQKPYTGDPMVQCDSCKEWFHCACINLDPDEAEDVDLWMCRSCEEKKKKKEDPPAIAPDEIPKEAIEEIVEKTSPPDEERDPPTPTEHSTEPQQQEQQQEQQQQQQQQQQPDGVRKETRQTRSRKCLRPSCNNPTRADSYCSDVCASKDALRKSDDSEYVPDSPPSPKVSPPPVSPPSVEKKQPKIPERRASSISSTSTTATKARSTPPKEASPPSDDSIRKNVVKNMTTLLQTILQTARTNNPDLFEEDEKKEERSEKDAAKAAELASAIEGQMFEQLAEDRKGSQYCGPQYKNKFRSLLYNLKDKGNQLFQLRVVTGDLPPKDLVAMSAQDMANPELRSMSASMMQESIKNSVLKIETMPLIKKTHKGDIIMVNNESQYTSVPEEREHGRRQEEEEFRSSTPTVETPRSQQNSGSLSDGFDSRKSSVSASASTPLETATTATAAATEQQQKEMTAFMAQLVGDAKDFDIASPTKKRKLEDMLGGDDDDDNHLVPEDEDAAPATTTDSMAVDSQQEDGSRTPPMYTQLPQQPQLPIVWRGRVNMPQVAEFNACARQMGGRTLTEHEWSEVLSPTMWIEGRIPMDRVASYVTQTQYSSSREIVLLEIAAATDGDQHPARALIDYFDSRKRYGVVGHNKTKIKDFYLIPLYRSRQLPDFSYVVRVEENQRDTDMFLGVLVLQKQRDTMPVPPARQLPIPAAPTMTSNSHRHHHHQPHQQYHPYPPAPSSAAQAPYYSSSSSPSSSLYYR